MIIERPISPPYVYIFTQFGAEDSDEWWHKEKVTVCKART